MKYEIESSLSFDTASDRDDVRQYLQSKSSFSELGDELNVTNDLDGTFKITHKTSFTTEQLRDEVYTCLLEKSGKARKDRPGYIQKQDVRNDIGEVFGETHTNVVIEKWGGGDGI